MYIADLHLHSRFSMATSRQLNIPHLSGWAMAKGINVLGTGDFTHPKWREELKRDLAFDAFVYPSAFMHAFTRAMAEFADALDLYALGDTSGAAAAAQRGLAALESAEALDARYCRGKWADWHKCRVQVPLPKIIEQACDLINGLK